MVWPAVIAAAAAVGGAVLGGKGNRRNMKSQQAWEEKMRETKWQTTVEDMKAAGINPMVAYSQGAGGNLSSPGASGGGDYSGVASSAMQGAKYDPEVKLMKSQESVNSANNLKTKEETKLTKVTIERQEAELKKFKESGSGIIPNTADFLKKQGLEIQKAWKKNAFAPGQRALIKKRRGESLRAFNARREYLKMPKKWQKKHKSHKHSHDIQGGKER